MELLRCARWCGAELVPQQRAQPLVELQRLGAVSLYFEDVHQQPVAGLAVRRRSDQRSRRTGSGVDFAAADLEAGLRDELERMQVEILEPSAPVVDPLRLLPGEERAAADVLRDACGPIGGDRVASRRRRLRHV